MVSGLTTCFVSSTAFSATFSASADISSASSATPSTISPVFSAAAAAASSVSSIACFAFFSISLGSSAPTADFSSLAADSALPCVGFESSDLLQPRTDKTINMAHTVRNLSISSLRLLWLSKPHDYNTDVPPCMVMVEKKADKEPHGHNLLLCTKPPASGLIPKVTFSLQHVGNRLPGQYGRSGIARVPRHLLRIDAPANWKRSSSLRVRRLPGYNQALTQAKLSAFCYPQYPHPRAFPPRTTQSL